MTSVNPVLARKLGRTDPEAQAEGPADGMNPARMLRVGLMRAADKAIGLSLSVLGVAEDAVSADALFDEGPEGWMVLGLCHPGQSGLAGLIQIDGAFRTAIIEVQTMGMLLESGDAERPVTSTDAALTLPLVEALLVELAAAAHPGFGPGLEALTIRPLPNLRAAGLMARDGLHRQWRMSVQIGGTDRQGEVILALAPAPKPEERPGVDDTAWSDTLRCAVEEVTADLDAVLCRMKLPVCAVENFEVGQVVALAGVTVGSVMLEGPGAAAVAAARLGQVSGMRAVRLEKPEVQIDLGETPMRSEASTAPKAIAAGIPEPDTEPSVPAPATREADLPAEA